MPARSRSWVSRALVLLAVVALVTASCGGGGSKTKASSTGSSTTTTTVQDVAADKATAEGAVLRLADLPSGWEQTTHQAGPDSPDLNTQLAACLNVDPKLLSTPDNPTSADSPDFSESNGATVSNTVSFTESVAKAKDAIAIFAKTELPGCLSKVITAQLTGQAPAGMTFGEIDVKRLTLHSEGDDTMALRVTIPIEMVGTPLTQYLDLVVVRVGRAGVTFTFSNTNAVVDSAFEERLIGVVIGRLRSTSSGSSGATTTTAAGKTTTTSSSSGGTTITSIPLSTSDEASAMATASLPEGRRWALGNPQGAMVAEGTPHLVGYLVALNDGTTQHSIEVINGKAVNYSGKYGPKEVTGPIRALTIEATSDQQRAYVRAAQVVAPSATAGGIEAYVFYFPQLSDGRYPMVAVFADSKAGTYAQGAPESR